MLNLYYKIFPHAITVLITMAVMGYDFGPIPSLGIW